MMTLASSMREYKYRTNPGVRLCAQRRGGGCWSGFPGAWETVIHPVGSMAVDEQTVGGVR